MKLAFSVQADGIIFMTEKDMNSTSNSLRTVVVSKFNELSHSVLALIVDPTSPQLFILLHPGIKKSSTIN